MRLAPKHANSITTRIQTTLADDKLCLYALRVKSFVSLFRAPLTATMIINVHIILA